MKKNFLKLFMVLFLLLLSDSLKANYWLVIGTYRQGPGGRPLVSGITSQSLHSIPMKDIDTFKKHVMKLQIKYINLSGNLIVNGIVYLVEIINSIIFLHRVHIHHLYNFHFHKNHFWFQKKQSMLQMEYLIKIKLL